jgi:hypothetical protein
MIENKIIKYVLYSPVQNGLVLKLTELLDESCPTVQGEVYYHWETLKNRMQQLRHDICSIILVAPTRYALEKIMALQPLLEGLKVVMVLPDRDVDTIGKAHRLRPRYFTFMDTDFKDIVTVLKKMSDKHRSVMLSIGHQTVDDGKHEKLSIN